MTLKEVRDFMDKQGIPGRDLYDLPGSGKTFPDGSNFRVEIAGIERASALEAMIEESEKRGVPVHRVVATVGGSTLCDAFELRDMAAMAAERRIEVVMAAGPRKAWDAGSKEGISPEGMMHGYRLRGSDSLSYWIADMLRDIEAGFRGFLVYDEGVLDLVNKMRSAGLVPKDTVFKFSVFGGCCNAAGAGLIESLGADSLNPLSDISLPMIAGIRKAIDIPLDIYLIVVDSFGGSYRIYEAPEICRVASPCYFKIEPGTSEGAIYKPWVPEEFHAEFARQKVKIASILLEIMDRHGRGSQMSPPGAADLVAPVPADSGGSR
jgi:hypothetical protein